MMKYLIAGCAFALALAIGHTGPAEATVSALPAVSPALASRNAPETFVLAPRISRRSAPRRGTTARTPAMTVATTETTAESEDQGARVAPDHTFR
jgi:hypothetical protein